MKQTRTGYELLQATVAEMSSDPAAFDVPVDQDKLKGILERDKGPRFVTIQVAREGVSRNGRNYSPRSSSPSPSRSRRTCGSPKLRARPVACRSSAAGGEA
jgi:hypothetical protein